MSDIDTDGVGVFEIAGMSFDDTLGDCDGSVPLPITSPDPEPIIELKVEPTKTVAVVNNPFKNAFKMSTKPTTVTQPETPPAASPEPVMEEKVAEVIPVIVEPVVERTEVSEVKKRGRKPREQPIENVTTTADLLNRVDEIVEESKLEIPSIYVSGVPDEGINVIKEFQDAVAIDEDIITDTTPYCPSGGTYEYKPEFPESQYNKPKDSKVEELKRKIELSNYAKGQLTDDMKKELGEIKASEITENLQKISITLDNYKDIMDSAAIPLDDWYKLLDDVRELKSDPLPSQPSPDEVIEGLVHLNSCIDRISDGYSNLCRINCIYKDSIDVLEKMWSVISLQGNETSRKGDLLVQLNSLMPYKTQLNAIMVAFEIEMSIIKQQQFVYQAIISVMQMQVNGLNDPFIKNKFDGFNS